MKTDLAARHSKVEEVSQSPLIAGFQEASRPTFCIMLLALVLTPGALTLSRPLIGHAVVIQPRAGTPSLTAAGQGRRAAIFTAAVALGSTAPVVRADTLEEIAARSNAIAEQVRATPVSHPRPWSAAEVPIDALCTGAHGKGEGEGRQGELRPRR